MRDGRVGHDRIGLGGRADVEIDGLEESVVAGPVGDAVARLDKDE